MEDKKFIQSAYINDWQRENRDRLVLLLPKNTKNAIKTAANKHGQSVNQYIQSLILYDIGVKSWDQIPQDTTKTDE